MNKRKRISDAIERLDKQLVELSKEETKLPELLSVKASDSYVSRETESFISLKPWATSYFLTEDNLRPPVISPLQLKLGVEERCLEPKPWTSLQAEKLKRGVAIVKQKNKFKPDTELNWDEIAERYGTGRSGIACKVYYEEMLDPAVDRSNFTKRELQRLMRIYQENNSLGWTEISDKLNRENRKHYVGGESRLKRTPWRCFLEVLRSSKSREQGHRKWTVKEDSLILKAVEVFGTSNWQEVAEFVQARNAAMCATRFRKTLCASTSRKRWTESEDLRLQKAVYAYGEEWTKVCMHIPGRTDVQCRERWFNTKDKKKSVVPNKRTRTK